MPSGAFSSSKLNKSLSGSSTSTWYINSISSIPSVGAIDEIIGISLICVTVISKLSVTDNSPSLTLSVTNPDVNTPSRAVQVIRPLSEIIIPSGSFSNV